MDLPKPQDGELINAWGYKFRWTSLHENSEQYHHLKYSYDKLAEDCLGILEEIASDQQKASPNEPEKLPPKRDLYAVLAQNHEKHEKLTQLWNEVTNVPEWVDWDQISRGQDVFYRYGAAAVTGLAFQSLLGSTGGSGRVSETLSKTGGFSPKVARRRLLETTQFILQVTESLDSVKPGGPGFTTSLRVRLLHASVRRRILQLAATRPEYYSVEQNGVPINDADCAGTIAIFSSVLIWQSLPRQGVFLRKQEIVDYVALWRLIAVYMGSPSDPFSTPEKAKATMESMLVFEYQPSTTSKLLARNIIRALENQPPTYPSRALIEINARWLNGNQLCDALEIGHPPFYYWLLVAGQCGLFASISYIARTVPWLDRLQIDGFRRTLWSSVIDGKHNGLGSLSVFDFKYVPGYGIGTKDDGDVVEGRSKVFWTADRKAFAAIMTPLLLSLLSSWALFRILSLMYMKVQM